MDIMLDRARLREALTGLNAAITAFDEAAAINNDLEEAVDRPDDRSSLRDKVGDFESAWNRKRDKLNENLGSIRDQLTSIVDNWDQWDTETAAELESAGSEQTTSARIARIQ
ncbi:hypothetical protein AB0O65_01175 [Microbacterium sp. NPDC077391]|uniref:Flagellar protein FlgN n=1 Tax=Microbacterium commune TaxID=2762219 RepID=A0ABR8W4D5_9MICO|nr:MULTISPECIES: hypothetical protein [Microbacterium]MBD8011511.1 hypothetical protein [Microbacterium commune]OIU84672.1 hypothetical protein BFN01_02530 [Microbacterium sp. AR7-10]